MASIILSNAGTIAGASMGGAIGSTIGQLAGSFAGRFIDQNIFGTHETLHSEGRRLSDLSVQSSAYGDMIPILFGTSVIAGNIIWATPLIETPRTIRTSGGSKGSEFTQSHTHYTYSVSLAIALCEGKISSINNIWADTKPIDPTLYNIRIYKGDEEQLPDTLIEKIEGIGKAPAYRGLAYVVFENLELAEFGNRIPNFTFSVRKQIPSTPEMEKPEDLIESVVIIPGCGEFAYDTEAQQKFYADHVSDTWVQRGLRKQVNLNNLSGKVDSLLALDDLQETLPNVKWVAPVISWFGSSDRLETILIQPGVEHKAKTITTPSNWNVAGYTRETAKLITQKDNRAIYGGTPTDESVLRFLDELKNIGYKIMFYPMLFIDIESKPWRGRLKGNWMFIEQFFHQAEGYNNFILHYAELVKDKVDAFIIGSEFRSLTSIKAMDKYPAVNEFVHLAKRVKAILGAKVKVSYAADWSEYHHTDGGWHHLDPLWASPDIDFIGIDAYFPLTNQKHSEYNIEKLINAWDSGEGYDYYYHDSEKKEGKKSLSPEWAWKNIRHWWENDHYDPNGKKTPWVPKSKKIWFTEYGFPSITCSSNQPNVFFDPSTSESKIPIHSSGHIDITAQRAAIYATEKRWQNSDMIERKFLWTWDARPYPYWPHLVNVWSDGECWVKGHWVQGKLGLPTLAQIILDLTKRTSLSHNDINVENLNIPVEGFCITTQTTIKKVIQTLQQAYFFDIFEDNKILTFLTRTQKESLQIDETELVNESAQNPETLNITRSQEASLPQALNLNFLEHNYNFRVSTVQAQRYHTQSHQKVTINLPLVMNEAEAEQIAEIALYNSWLERTQYRFTLPVKYAFLKPSNLLEIAYKGQLHSIRITNTYLSQNRVLQVEGVAESMDLYENKAVVRLSPFPENENIPADTAFELLDIPLLPNESTQKNGRVLIAACALSKNWRGCSVHVGSHPNHLNIVSHIPTPSTFGYTLNTLEKDLTYEFDYKSKLIVNLIHGSLKSITHEELLEYGNLAVIGNEIVQFQYAKLIDHHQYELSGFLRGRFNTKQHINKHLVAERFVLLDENLAQLTLPNFMLDKKLYIKAVSYGQLEISVSLKEIIYQGNSLKPYSPCHVTLEKLPKQNNKISYKLSWLRRTRTNGELKDFHEVPLNEEKELYLVEIITPTLKESITTAETSLILEGRLATALEDKQSIIKISQFSENAGKGIETIYKI